jgi:hypothetical protein
MVVAQLATEAVGVAAQMAQTKKSSLVFGLCLYCSASRSQSSIPQ